LEKTILFQETNMGEYKIKDIEILTGIKAHTLRIWEKRYGIPSPSRTVTKIRNYSDEDLIEILNVAILNKNGWKISRIAELNSGDKASQVISLRDNRPADIYHENLLLALIEINEHLFFQTINDLIAEFGVVDTFSVHLTEFLDRIGIMWITGSIQPGQEHFISHLIRQKLIALTDSIVLPDQKSPKVLLFLPENEWHELSLLFYHFILRNKGIYSIYMGQSLPYNAIVDTINHLKPVALLTSCLAAADDNFYQEFFEKLKKDSNQLPIFAGGFQIIGLKNELKKWVSPLSSLKDLDPLFDLTKL
jgi:MerR family transcriptional regulator, light-induced transcriptional regulator